MRSLKLAFATTLLLPLVALANGYDVPNTNPRDLGMAGSATAAQEDAAAAYANPAALSRLTGLNVNGALGVLSLNTKWTGDRSEAGKTLSALAASRNIVQAAIYGKDGAVFAQYRRDRAADPLLERAPADERHDAALDEADPDPVRDHDLILR